MVTTFVVFFLTSQKQQNKDHNYADVGDSDDRASTRSSVTKSVKSLQIADGASGSQQSSPGSTSSILACSQAAKNGNKDRSHSCSPGSSSSMPECSQAAAASTTGVCIVTTNNRCNMLYMSQFFL